MTTKTMPANMMKRANLSDSKGGINDTIPSLPIIVPEPPSEMVVPAYIASLFRSMYATNAQNFVTWPGLSHMSGNPTNLPKANALVIAPQISGYKSSAAVKDYGYMSMLWIDIDHGNCSLDFLVQKLITMEIESYIIYSTSSATANNRKWRILIELACPITIYTWQQKQIELKEEFNGDSVATRPSQIIYAPNVIIKGDFYESKTTCC